MKQNTRRKARVVARARRERARAAKVKHLAERQTKIDMTLKESNPRAQLARSLARSRESRGRRSLNGARLTLACTSCCSLLCSQAAHNHCSRSGARARAHYFNSNWIRRAIDLRATIWPISAICGRDKRVRVHHIASLLTRSFDFIVRACVAQIEAEISFEQMSVARAGARVVRAAGRLDAHAY